MKVTLSLANKYRPQYFEGMVGQESIIMILQNQIKFNDFKQGYLFCGGAGTGKTSAARIFAREINNGSGEIIEIDAASNNGVEAVRELREKCKFKPLQGDYKVYIIDEVHMLSTGAFNALLKTLEEPPAHVVFILCTTDPQKVPATIISRVQRFDFMRMTVTQLSDQLKKIISIENSELEEETYEIDEEVYDYISKIANGGMRNAISILDTCIGYKNHLQLNDIFQILGATDHQAFIKTCRYIMDNKAKGDLLELIEQLHLDGKDLKQFVKGLIEFVVDLRKLDLLEDFEYVNAPPIYEKTMYALIDEAKDGNEDLNEWFKKLTELHNMIKYESNPKTLIQGWLMTI
jgi:DNA polymerase-3 subunit gamma/tau